MKKRSVVSNSRAARQREQVLARIPNPITVAKLDGLVDGAIGQLVDSGQIKQDAAPAFRAVMGMLFGSVVEKTLEVELPVAGGGTEKVKVTKADAQRVGMNALVDLCRLETAHAFGKK